ncbi:alpha-2-macroglobulin family protein [Chryseobacterium gregarium]|uniref:alpha-2-macroglobulin family protein n=1 Tax=Chryseobacterium gregarium TaxID=456299 RepID=UPI0003FBFAE6|nr:alpha-2-macroglobulin family protein [Chryseobacterium gregarium]
MKRFSKIFMLLLLLLNCSGIFAQKYYDEQWKEVAEGYKNGMFKSSFPIILEIQKKAIRDKNALQLIRSLKAEFAIYKDTQDDPKNDYASVFFSKIKNTENQLKGDDLLFFKILEIEFFEGYMNASQWQILQRTNLAKSDITELESWTKLDFKNYYTEKLSELNKADAQLKQIQLEKYKDVFAKEKDFEFFPTLYDWKTKKNIEFLKNEFLFTKNELKENQKTILSLYQDLITFNNNNPKLYFQFEKLNFRNQIANDKKYTDKLKELINSPVKGDYKIMIAVTAASLLHNEKNSREAVQLIDQVKAEYQDSQFINHLISLENNIRASGLQVFYEENNLPDQPVHLVAKHRNADHFSIKIYRVNDFKNQLPYLQSLGYDEYYKKINKTLFRTNTFTLPGLNDYQEHTTSLEMKSLPKGMYVGEYINGSEVSKFLFVITSSRVIFDEKRNYILVSRENGASKNNTLLEYYRFMDYSKTSETPVLIKTDGAGKFSGQLNWNDSNYLVYAPGSNDFNILRREYNDWEREWKRDPQIQIFLDRQIYRPGQTVYFKAIATYPDYEKRSDFVMKDDEQEISLYDANDQKMTSQKFKTNEFGSYTGSFVLPKDRLNGKFSLRGRSETRSNMDGSVAFSVEEYKRPKFEIIFDTIKNEYKYGQAIELKGKVMTFSGIPLSNSTINFDIKRENIRYRYFWWYPYDSGNENTVLGKAETNEKGEFTIKIDLKKDENTEGIQVHNYHVNASLTDVNGETQSAETDVKVASVSHYLKANDIKEEFAENEVKLKVEAFNYNDIALTKSYQVKLMKLQEPQRVLRDNFKNVIQDLPKLSKEEFLAKFPHDRYDKFDDKKNWKVERVVSERIENTKSLNLGKLEAGEYRLELYNIEGKDTVKVQQDFGVWSKKGVGKSQFPFLKIIGPEEPVSRGAQALVYVYSKIPDAVVHIYLQDGTGDTKFENGKFNNGLLVYKLPVSQDKRIVKYNVQFSVVHYNDVQNQFVNINVKDADDPLKIELTTFRDKLEPNSKEKWSIKITGKSKEKTVAEVLANMYDKSLDKFAPNTYAFSTLYKPQNIVRDFNIRSYPSVLYWNQKIKYLEGKNVYQPQFSWFDKNIFFDLMLKYGLIKDTDGDGVDDEHDECPTVPGQEYYKGCPASSRNVQSRISEEVVLSKVSARFESTDGDGVLDKDDARQKAEKPKEDPENVQARKNLNETAFFYPQLKTDANGNVNFEFTTPEALTKWKLMFLAHTTDARSAVLEQDIITRKKFSVTPNYPRFLREGDELNFQAKISNLEDKALAGSASLQILNAETNEDISALFGIISVQNFEVNAAGNAVISWNLKAPFNKVSSVIIKVVAKAGEYSDGEQIPVGILSNRMLLTDALPVFVKEGQTKTFTLESLKNNTSATVANFSNTLELKTNPVWEIIFALPNLSDNLNISSDAIFNTWFADVVGSEIFKANPRMQAVFSEYKNADQLKSNLEKNQELKQLLLEETPWVLQSQSETETMNSLSRLFDVSAMRSSINKDWSHLKQYQNGDGGFPWLPGFESSYTSSLYILRNLGKMNEWLKDDISLYQTDQDAMVARLIGYIDSELEKYWKESEDSPWSNFALDYLDTRRYWEKQYPLSGKGQLLKSMIINRSEKFKFTDLTFYGLHRSALIFDHYGLKKPSDRLISYIKETSTSSETQGIYWKQNFNDWGWYNSKTVNHAGAIEALNKLDAKDVNFIEEAKVWLATQKEVNSWGNSRNTAEVVYVMMNSGKSWTGTESDKATVIWGGKEVIPQTKTTGYLKQTIKTDVLDKNLGTVTITKPGPGIVQGGLFWQYFENLDEVKSTETYIAMTREYYKKVKTTNGDQLVKIEEKSPLTVGDKITVRMILDSDRPMQYVHLKDMRAAGLEPVDVISGYQWKNNLGYYQATKDASTNFYIYYMPKGKYVFEYDLICNASGSFSSGFATLQNYYASQMNARTKGNKIEIKKSTP